MDLMRIINSKYLYIGIEAKSMNLNSVQQSIKIALNVITKAIKQVPKDKQTLLTSRVNDVMSKHMTNPNPTLQQLNKFQKQLEFNLNFIKLSHPNLDFTPPTAEELLQKQRQLKQQEEKPLKEGEKPEVPHKVEIINQQHKMEYQRIPNDVFDTAQERQKNIREEVSFSNWFEGNVDPQLLQKHKKLLERQHFQGDYWQDKQKPSIVSQEYLKQAMEAAIDSENIPKKQKQLQDITPKNTQEVAWQKVKR